MRGCRVAGSGGGQVAKDAAGNDVRASKWLETHKSGALQLPTAPPAAQSSLGQRVTNVHWK